MKSSEHNHFKTFKGAGYLLGSAITFVAGILVFLISNDFAIAISASLPIGITVGVALEEKIQKGKEPISPKAINWMIGLLVLGIIVFIALFFLIKNF